MLHNLQKDFVTVALGDQSAALVSRIRAKTGTVERRLSIHRTNTLNSLTDVLRAAFPVCERIVGKKFFRRIASAFIETHPPQRPALFTYGEDLPEFLNQFAPAQAIPYLADVARLEWARMESYFAHDANLLNPKTLDAIPPEQLKTVIFKVHPSYRLIQSSFPVFTTWEVNQPEYGEIPELDFSESERGSVLRIGHQIVQRKLSEPEFHWLKLITAGEMLGNATASVMSTTPSFDLQETLKIVLVEGVICGICDERE